MDNGLRKENRRKTVLQIFEKNRGVIINEVRNYRRNRIDFDELMQIAYFGVCTAVNSYDENTGVPFQGYMKFCIRRTILREINKIASVKTSEYMKCKIRMYFAIKSRLHRKLMREPTAQEIADELGCSENDIIKVEKNDIHIEVSLDELYENISRDKIGVFCSNEEGYDEIIELDFKQALWKTVAHCVNEKQYEILQLYFAGMKTLKEISVITGTSIDTIYKRKQAALQKLKRDKEIRFFWNLMKQ